MTASSSILAIGSVPDEILSAFKLVKFAPLTAGSVSGNLPFGIVPIPRLSASSDVKFAPLTAGSVAGNLSSAIVPVKLAAGKAVNPIPDPLNDVAVQTPVTTTPSFVVFNF